jgi:D-arginine dehydrogenase
MTQTFDIAVIGAGIAGASVAARLAMAGKRVVVLEMESQAGYHTTGRSAAVFAPNYGPRVIRALARASRPFYEAPPQGFSETPLFSPRLILMLARADQRGALDRLLAQSGDDPLVLQLNEAEMRQINPLIREGYGAAGMVDRAGQDIDVGGLHQGFLRQFKSVDGAMMLKSEVLGMERVGDVWQIATKAGQIAAGVVVNAAGAWADVVGEMAGAETIVLTPKRRTAAIVAGPSGIDATHFPITIDINEQFYLKPDAGRLLISPADETPSAPCDAQPEELDIAICVDRIETAFDVSVTRIENKWAGLRSFVPDGSPVAGFSERVDGFYWLAGQGGYGIQTAPALSEFAATQIMGLPLPEHLLAQEINVSDMAVGRL